MSYQPSLKNLRIISFSNCSQACKRIAYKKVAYNKRTTYKRTAYKKVAYNNKDTKNKLAYYKVSYSKNKR